MLSPREVQRLMREGLEMGEAFHATVEVKTAEETSVYASSSRFAWIWTVFTRGFLRR